MSWILEYFVAYLLCVYMCSGGYVEVPIVLLYLLRCLVDRMLSKTRRNSRSLHRVIAYRLYVVFTSVLGVSHPVQNEKKLCKFTQSARRGISARSAGGGV